MARVMKRPWITSTMTLCGIGIVALAAGCASGGKTKPIASIVPYSAVDGCQPVGYVKDEDLDDLQRKAAKQGGNAVVVIGQSRDVRGYALGHPAFPILRDRMIGDVYRCQAVPVEKAWAKRGSSMQDSQRDDYECVRDARSPSSVGSGTLGIVGTSRSEDNLYKMCMRVRGYELEPKR